MKAGARTAPEVVVFESVLEPVDRKAKAKRISGRAVPYGVWTNRGWFLERVQAGALDKSISESAQGLPLHLFHDTDTFPVGVSEEWDSRKDALYGVWRLDDSEEAQRAWQLADDGLLRFLSVGISPVRSEWQTVAPEQWNPDAGPDFMDKLTRVEARLLETSMLTTPAFATAEILSTFGAEARKLLERTSVPRQPQAERFPSLRAWREIRHQLTH